MGIEETFSVSEVMVGGRLPDAGVGIRQGDRVVVPVTYQAFPNIDEAVHVMVLDADSGAPLSVWSDSRCRGTGTIDVDADGVVYVSGSNGYVLPDFGESSVPPTCLLRILPGEDGFDEDWWIDFRTSTGGLDATGFRLVDSEHAVLFVFDPERLPADADADRALYYTSASSRWWMLDVISGEASPLSDLPWIPSGSGIASSLEDDSVLLSIPDAYPAVNNRFVRLNASGETTEIFEFTGRGQLWPLIP